MYLSCRRPNESLRQSQGSLLYGNRGEGSEIEVNLLQGPRADHTSSQPMRLI